MRKFAIGSLLALVLAGCISPGTKAENPNDTTYTWSYVKGPGGEDCLVATRYVGSETGTAMMDCRWPGETR